LLFSFFYDKKNSAPLKQQRDLSEMAGWVYPTKKDMGLFGRNILLLLFLTIFLLSLKRKLKPIRALHHVREFRKKN